LAGSPHLHFVVTRGSFYWPYKSIPVTFSNTLSNERSLALGTKYKAFEYWSAIKTGAGPAFALILHTKPGMKKGIFFLSSGVDIPCWLEGFFLVFAFYRSFPPG